MDVDNFLKPIQDALTGIAYRDDMQVVDGRAHKRSLDGVYRIRGVSLVLLEAFSRSEPFVHVRMTAPDEPTRPPGVI